MPWFIVADAHCSTSPEDGFRRRFEEHAEHMQHPAAMTDAGTMRSAQDGASVSNKTRDVGSGVCLGESKRQHVRRRYTQLFKAEAPNFP